MSEFREPTEDETTGFGCREIALQVRGWLDWHRKSRDREHLTTEEGTAIMGLPVPTWPTHGQFEAWIETLELAADKLDPHRAYEPKP